MSEFELRNRVTEPLTPPAVCTQAECRKRICPYYPQMPGAGGQVHYILCHGPACAAWRWTRHFKIENREPRPLGYCGRVGYPDAVVLESLPQVLPADEPVVPSPGSPIVMS